MITVIDNKVPAETTTLDKCSSINFYRMVRSPHGPVDKIVLLTYGGNGNVGVVLNNNDMITWIPSNALNSYVVEKQPLKNVEIRVN